MKQVLAWPDIQLAASTLVAEVAAMTAKDAIGVGLPVQVRRTTVLRRRS